MINMRNALKALGALLMVVALCAPLMLLPEDAPSVVLGYAGVTITVPPTVVVATTIPGLEPTTTTTEVAPPPPPEPTSSTTTTTTTPTIDITIAAAGDIPAPMPILESVRDPKTNSYDFAPVFAPIAPYLSKADYTVAALQPRLAGLQAGYSSYPTANAPGELAYALKHVGVDLLATANLHSLDLGADGVSGTLDRLDAAGIAHVGTSRSQRERDTPVIADIRGIRVAFLDYTGAVAKVLLDVDKKDFVVNTLDLATVRKDAMTARGWGADAVIAMIDFSSQDQQPPNDPKALSEEILNNGVDAILGCNGGLVDSIGHIFPRSWLANDKYVAYSLGDFLSTQQADNPDTGLIAYIHLQKRGLRTYVTGVSYLPVYMQTSTATEETPAKYRVLPVLPGLEPATDVALTNLDRQRMAQEWNDFRRNLYRPDENISPLAPADLAP
jgi:poly-gamma-glutamate capsule biosynthesis protein CapA/YwtB (metallophosphatase superfamily)